ncbi:MAG: hypothetical protein CVV27_13365 [Candidatus Melainabacteria bacterium HGW-Melainabacteria-1]|nr:MAG: hypothetical protein CVV27_13365 [Candidatus Melainabacteria bacterium HGW-Melainabacteria-1]
MQIHTSAIWKDVAGPNLRPVGPDTPAPEAPPAVLPEWITDTFAAQYATQLLQKAGHTAAGTLIQRILQDPFVFLSHNARVGGLRGSVAAANASVVASVAPNRLAGTIVGATVGALAGASQAMLTFPGRATVIVGAVHGLVRGAVAGNVAVLEKNLHSPALLRADARLW